MRSSVVLAPDSFKGTISARDAAASLAEGWLSVLPNDAISALPQADGGEGTLDAVELAVPGSERQLLASVTGPDGRPVAASWLLLPDGTAVVELAQSSGLPLMARLDPLGATTRGLGEVVAAALAMRPRRLLVGLGGSASTDGGVGVLEVVPDVDVPVVLLTDVTAPLLGTTGAAAVFGPQKGAGVEQVGQLEARLRELAERMGGDPGAAGAGAAGGTGYGLATAWGASIQSGSEFLAELTGLDAAIAEASVVLTGEGRFDGQSLTGKVVGRVLERAAAHGITAAVIAGELGITPAEWSLSLSVLAGSRQAARADPARWLRLAGARAAAELPR